MQTLTRLDIKFILFSLIIFLTFINLIIITPSAFPEKTMEIMTEEEIYEEKNFSISVLDPELFDIEDIETPYLSDVQIEFDGKNYYIDENLETTILAPKVSQNEIFTIKATKEGYITSYKNITILDSEYNKLEIIHDDYIVDSGKKFSVQVIDEDGQSIEGVEVYIQNSLDPSTLTNEKGYATLKAPDNEESFVIIAKKDGYDYVTQAFSANIQPSWFDSLINNQLLPIFIGGILLIFAIIFVNFKQKASIYNRSKEISQQKTLNNYDLNPEVRITGNNEIETQEKKYYSRDVVRSQQSRDAKVEEIRITRPRKEKEVIPVDSKEDETEKVINRNKMHRQNYDWFEGTDDIRYEIDKLTGKIDEEHMDKWFEGVGDLKLKVKEKVKKKGKKTN